MKQHQGSDNKLGVKLLHLNTQKKIPEIKYLVNVFKFIGEQIIWHHESDLHWFKLWVLRIHYDSIEEAVEYSGEGNGYVIDICKNLQVANV